VKKHDEDIEEDIDGELRSRRWKGKVYFTAK
jgi:hypothetical protein